MNSVNAKPALLLAVVLGACGNASSEDGGTNHPDSLSIIAPFSGPESVQYYPEGDEYFVSNANGDMTVKDDNGFISGVSPDGHVIQLKWIDGGTLPVTLQSRPNGLTVGPEGLTIATFASKLLLRVRRPGGKPNTIATLMGRSLDGLVRGAHSAGQSEPGRNPAATLTLEALRLL